MERISWPISPPPTNHSWVGDKFPLFPGFQRFAVSLLAVFKSHRRSIRIAAHSRCRRGRQTHLTVVFVARQADSKYRSSWMLTEKILSKTDDDPEWIVEFSHRGGDLEGDQGDRR